MQTEHIPDVLTPEQAADDLQLNRETVYRYLREGKLVASKLGRTYRIPRPGLDRFRWATRTRQDVTLREYPGQQIEQSIEADQLDAEAHAIAEQFVKVGGPRTRRRALEEGKLTHPAGASMRPRRCSSTPRGCWQRPDLRMGVRLLVDAV